MLFARKEVNLVNGFQMLDTREIFLVHETEEIENIVASILTRVNGRMLLPKMCLLLIFTVMSSI